MRKIVVCFGLVTSLFSNRLYERMEFLVQSIPKGGTHLLTKTLETLRFEGCPPRYRWAHFSLGQAYCAHRNIYPYLLKHPEKKKVVLVRDMRDVLIALMFYLDKMVTPGKNVWFDVKSHSEEMVKWGRLRTIDEKLDYLLSPSTNFFAFSEKQCADDSFALVKMPNTLLLRYEDLVGPNGGGSTEKQLEAVQSLSQFVCRKPLSDERLHIVAAKIYGGKTFKEGGHFRSGQIGEWRRYFKPHHIDKVKKLYNRYLIAYGYEANDSWR